ncbi:uncharacterized protein [Anabrus simplex]|uniref:uncharacterized protein n=1 Tax=Anabrus simplex TaxID=316456 RepID=UPI0035A2E2DD
MCYSLNNPAEATATRFQYLVRLDALSCPPLYPDTLQPTCRLVEGVGGDGIPQGFAKIRIQGESADEWAEFINPAGFLRRDKIQEHFVELLAQAAARVSAPSRPDLVDESILCGCPGKLVDIGVLDRVLHLLPQEQVFYGAADCNQSRFPDPRDFRIAIVEGAPEVRLRVGFLSPALAMPQEDVEVRLILAVGFKGWPQASDFPARIPLGHLDCLLFQQAAQTGFYLVPGPPHPTVRCDDRTATWQIWLPTGELLLNTHYSSTSVPGRVLSIVEAVLYQLRGRSSRFSPLTNRQMFLKVVSRYMVRTLLWFHLERHATLLAWAPDMLSTHVIRLLDMLVTALRTQRHRSYFFPWCNVMLHAAFGGLHHTEEDYLADADSLDGFLRSLHQESSIDALPSDNDVDSERYLLSERLEVALLTKWKDVLTDLAPPATTRSRRLSFSASPNSTMANTTAAAAHYTPRQLDYISNLFREMLKVRQLTLQNQNTPSWLQVPLHNSSTIHQEDPVEDLIYLLTAILDQAKELCLGEKSPSAPLGISHGRRRHGKKTTSRTGTKSDPGSKFRVNFDNSVAYLIDFVRRDVETSNANLGDDSVLVRQVLKWLYRALDSDKRHLAPVLRPYLNRLFATSHENGWHLDEWRKRNSINSTSSDDELKALGTFCRLIISGEINPTEGMFNAESKGWCWAESMVETAEYLAQCPRSCSDLNGEVNSGLHLVFTPGPGKVLRHTICLPTVNDCLYGEDANDRNCSRLSSSKSRSATNTLKIKKATMKKATATLPALSSQHINPITSQDELSAKLHNASSSYTTSGGSSSPTPPHCRLRDVSPLTILVDSQRRYGQQRGVGDIINALISLHKFSVLQEVSALLPDSQRGQVLDAIQKISKETRRQRARGKAATLAGAISSTTTYRPMHELRPSAIPPDENSLLAAEREKAIQRLKGTNTLLGTCRAARKQHGNSPRLLIGGSGLFLDSPVLPPAFRGYPTGPHDPSSVALLQLTEDRQLRLARPMAMVASGNHENNNSNENKLPARKKDIVTKL